MKVPPWHLLVEAIFSLGSVKGSSYAILGITIPSTAVLVEELI